VITGQQHLKACGNSSSRGHWDSREKTYLTLNRGPTNSDRSAMSRHSHLARVSLSSASLTARTSTSRVVGSRTLKVRELDGRTTRSPWQGSRSRWGIASEVPFQLSGSSQKKGVSRSQWDSRTGDFGVSLTCALFFFFFSFFFPAQKGLGASSRGPCAAPGQKGYVYLAKLRALFRWLSSPLFTYDIIG
jgi:hypothetical protein